MTAKEIMTQLNNLDEHHSIEAKRGGDIDKSFLETVCAFANEPGLGGGTLILGVDWLEDALFPTYEVVGVSQPDILSQRISTQCATIFNVPIRPKVRTEMHAEKVVIVVEVAEADNADKPIYIKSLGLPRGAYRRIGSTDQHCGEDDLLVFYSRRSGETQDQAMVSGAGMADLDPEAIEFYRRLRARVNAAAEELGWSDLDLLVALGAVRQQSHGPVPTVAGVLLFGTRAAQRRLFPMMRVDYIRVPGTVWVEDPDDRFTTIDMRGPLLNLVQRAQSAVVDDLPKGFVLPEGESQADTPQLSSRVLREAIVNAVMHRSYHVQGAVQIIRYNNRIEIINPGYSLKSEDRLGEPGSETRNPHIAAVFHETNFAETKGSGIRTMRRLMDQSGFAPPTFESDRAGNRFVARLLLHHFLSPADLRWLVAFDECALNDEQRKALIFLREAGALDNATYRQLNAVDTLTASQDLRRLRQLLVLAKKGQGASTYYLPGPRFPTGGNTQAWGTGVISSEAGVISTGTGVIDSEAGVINAGTGAQNSLLHHLPEELRLRLPNKSTKLGDEILRSLILELCALRQWASNELATLLNREEKNLRRRHLTPLVRAGYLAYAFPDMVNHPRQGYRLPTSKPEQDR